MAGKTVAQKARVKAGARVAVINRVAGVVEGLGLPEVAFVKPPDAQLVFLFARTRDELEARMPPTAAALGPAAALWVFFRKGSRDAGLDMNRDTVWAVAEKVGLRPLGLLSVDDTWSAFRFRRASRSAVSGAVQGGSRVLRFHGGVKRDGGVEAWLNGQPEHLRSIVRPWFELMRQCGPDVRELMHDGCPTACVGDAGFGYVNSFKAHAAVGFFRGAVLPDPSGLLEGTGKLGRHVKLRPGEVVNAPALEALIRAAYGEIKARLRAESALDPALGRRGRVDR